MSGGKYGTAGVGISDPCGFLRSGTCRLSFPGARGIRTAPAIHRETDDERHGEEDERADGYQPCVGGRAAYGQLRRREKGDDEREEHGQKPDAPDGPHAGVPARDAVAAGQVGLRVAQADARSVHHHIHHQVEPYGQCAQQEERHAHVVHDDVERREQRDDAALYDEDVDLYAVFVGFCRKQGSTPS